jgi:hypothetical protein
MAEEWLHGLEWIAELILGKRPWFVDFGFFQSDYWTEYKIMQFLDRKAGLCGVYGTQLLPPGDAVTREMIALFDKGMYELQAKPKVEHR